MPLADSNIWLALALSKHEFHDATRTWLEEQRPHEALFCRSTQQSFLRLLTTRAVLAPYHIPPLSNQEAWTVYDGFRADKRIAWAEEPGGLDARWKSLAARGTPSPKLWMDAYLAAFAIAGGYQFVTTDQGFAQFSGLDLFVLSPKD